LASRSAATGWVKPVFLAYRERSQEQGLWHKSGCVKPLLADGGS
jgi:hypothetical protein